MRDRLQKFRSEKTDLMNKSKEYHAYEVGQIVYMYQVKGSIVQTGSWKISCYCGTSSTLFNWNVLLNKCNYALC